MPSAEPKDPRQFAIDEAVAGRTPLKVHIPVRWNRELELFELAEQGNQDQVGTTVVAIVDGMVAPPVHGRKSSRPNPAG